MSPVAGVGINYAIQDAVSAANILAGPLRESQARLVAVDEKHLAAVQRRRELPTRVIQALQAQVQRTSSRPRSGRAGTSLPAPAEALPVSLLRDLPGRLIGYGVWPRASGNPAVRGRLPIAPARRRGPTRAGRTVDAAFAAICAASSEEARLRLRARRGKRPAGVVVRDGLPPALVPRALKLLLAPLAL
jgi:hypothetical protein